MADTIATDREEVDATMARTTMSLSVVLLIVTACDPMSAPLARHEGGYRLAEENDLELWMGAQCGEVTALEVVLSNEGEDFDVARFESVNDEGTSITRWILGSTPEGFDVIDPMDADWGRADNIRIRVEADDFRTSSHLVVNSFSEEASARADDWYVQDEGWLTEPEYDELLVAEDGILPLCPTTD